MSIPHPPGPLLEADYEAIEAAVMETDKGRWFLAEFARRNRVADTEKVLGAIGGLERILKRERRPDADRIRLDIGEMKEAIERTKREIAQVKLDGPDGSHFDKASNELDAIVIQTETATSDILSSAEKLQEIAWTMREGGIDGEISDALEALATTIYTSCSFQDITGQRTQKVVHVLRYLESRIDTMIDIWGMEGDEVEASVAAAPSAAPHIDTRPDAHLLNGPALIGQGMEQDRIDNLMFDAVESTPPSGPEAATVEALLADDLALDWPEEASIATQTAPEVPAAEPESDVMALADEAIDAAIETLKEVSASAKRPPVAGDPFDKLSKTERQALFS